ncbi:hypothetical protein SVAN01_09152, partial [Stagonosporopsis vannaccii]
GTSTASPRDLNSKVQPSGGTSPYGPAKVVEEKNSRQEARDSNIHARDLEDNYKSRISQLQIELDKSKDTVAHHTRSIRHMISMANNRDSFLGEQASDEEILVTFEKLMSDIKFWSTRFNSNKKAPSRNRYGVVSRNNDYPFRTENLSKYRRVAPAYLELHHLSGMVDARKKKRGFVRGWVAYVMCTKLFRSLSLPPVGDSGEDVWLEKVVSDNFRCLENRLWYSDREAVSYSSFNDWRALTAELLSTALRAPGEGFAGEAAASVRAAISEVMNLVESWHKTGEAADLEADEVQLYRIFENAVQFAKTLRRQRALWSVRFPAQTEESGFVQTLRFDSKSMEDYYNEDDGENREISEQCYVELIMTPALYKRGTTSGGFFDKEDAIRRAEVVVLAPT